VDGLFVVAQAADVFEAGQDGGGAFWQRQLFFGGAFHSALMQR